MPESGRIDVYTDLSPDVAEEIQRDVERLVALEKLWVETGDVAAYEEWKLLADITFRRAKENVALSDEETFL
ncbi:MAG: hypothetical protein WEB00_07660 [Dehalococcoidia bacterium]